MDDDLSSLVAVAQLVASMVLVGVTIAYVMLTRSIAKATSNQASLFEKQLALVEAELDVVRAQPVLAVRPVVAIVGVSVSWRGEDLSRIQFEMANLGVGAATGIAVGLRGCGWDCSVAPVEVKRQGPLAATESRIFVGTPDRRTEGEFVDESEPRLDFQVSFRDVFGNPYSWRQAFAVIPTKSPIREIEL